MSVIYYAKKLVVQIMHVLYIKFIMDDKSLNVKKNNVSNSPYTGLPVMYAVARTLRVILHGSCSLFTGVYIQQISGGRRKWNPKDWGTGSMERRNRSIELNQTPRICSIKVIIQHRRKACWCTIMHETHVLSHSSRYSLPRGCGTENKVICFIQVLRKKAVSWQIFTLNPYT